MSDLTPIVAGTVFDTPFEKGCVAMTAPDETGWFEASDSEGVVCSFTDPSIVPGAMPLTIRGATTRPTTVTDLYGLIAQGLRGNPDLRWGSEQGPGGLDAPLTVHVTNIATHERYSIVVSRKDD